MNLYFWTPGGQLEGLAAAPLGLTRLASAG
jgi:hypothetical protein